MISVAREVPPVRVHQMPAEQCHVPVPISATYQCIPVQFINATNQCPSELLFSVTHQCHLSMPISATYQCCQSVPPISAISAAYQCQSVPP
ncbi:unnamed protein product, partial [Staurois parvus]